jgi:hypothetical protein
MPIRQHLTLAVGLCVSLATLRSVRAQVIDKATADVVKAASDINVCVPRVSSVPPRHDEPLPREIIASCNDRLATPYKYATGQQPLIRNTNLVLIYIGDGSKTLGSYGVTAVSTTIGGSSAVDTCDTTQASTANSYFLPCWINSDYFPDASQGDVITFAVTEATTYNFYAVYTRRVTLAGKAYGFWFPIGMFATDFKSSADGIGLAVLPIGLAWGAQYHFSGTDYLGLSIFGSWSIIPQKADSGANMSMDNSYTLRSATGGALADLDGYVYVGAGYSADFRTGFSNPGLLMAVGVGPRLLEILKAQPK